MSVFPFGAGGDRFSVTLRSHNRGCTWHRVDLLHAPNRRNRKPQALHGRVDCCFAECHPLLTPWTEKFHHAGAPLEHLGPLAGGQQTAHGFAHRPPRATGGASTALGLKGEPYLSSQTSSIRAPLEMLLTMIVRPLTWGCQQVARRS